MTCLPMTFDEEKGFMSRHTVKTDMKKEPSS